MSINDFGDKCQLMINGLLSRNCQKAMWLGLLCFTFTHTHNNVLLFNAFVCLFHFCLVECLIICNLIFFSICFASYFAIISSIPFYFLQLCAFFRFKWFFSRFQWFCIFSGLTSRNHLCITLKDMNGFNSYCQSTPRCHGHYYNYFL